MKKIPNLRIQKRKGKTYYSWRDPRTRKESSLKAIDNEALAISRAEALNQGLALEKIKEDAVIANIATQGSDMLLADFMAMYMDIMKNKRHLAENTLRTKKCLAKPWVDSMGDKWVSAIKVADIRKVIRIYENTDRLRMAQSLRSHMLDVLNVARAEGIIPPEHPNVADVSSPVHPTIKRDRMTLDQWLVIREEAVAMQPWVGSSMDLAMVSGLRVSDISTLQYRKGKDWQKKWIAWQQAKINGRKLKVHEHPYAFIDDEYLHCVVFKGKGTLLKLPLDLHQDATGLTLRKVIEATRSRYFICRHVIHHTQPFGNAPVGAPVHLNTISRKFGEARQRTALDWAPKDPPPFHEQRSVAERLYEAQGLNTQVLLGHKDRKTTRIYHDPRGAEWTTLVI